MRRLYEYYTLDNFMINQMKDSDHMNDMINQIMIYMNDLYELLYLMNDKSDHD